MDKETISDKQAISIMILFLSGSTSIFVTGLDAKKDLWISIIVAIFMVFPMIAIFARLHYLFPNKDIFDIIEKCFGKFLGKGIIIIFTWYSFYWAADVLNNYGLFIESVSLTYTPRIVSILFLAFLCSWSMYIGIEVLGRCAKVLAIVAIISIFLTVILLIPQMNINNLRPLLGEGVKPVIKGAYSVFTQPFVQTVAFTMAFSSFRRRKSSYKIYFMGLLLGAMVTLIISGTNLLIIGINEATTSFYPSYTTVSRMDIGDLLQRLEVIIAIVFVLGGFIKISILLLCTCKGITKLFGFQDYRFMVWVITLLVINLSYFQYENVMHYFVFNTKVWPYYFFPFQIALPILIWITAEIKIKQCRKR
ncbi:GerAB/ArcD/ProY family transporter [Wukongibacter sp. M2B1]|uniref:GerAB/ArcD/ProY family transporter n=1 Tax=Wukongibacter sp. M2B1 TaxID=3088895 RepID=UPI003D7A4615